MASVQTLSETERRRVASWAADCAERVLPLFEAEAPADGRPRDAITRTRAFAAGQLTVAGEVARRVVASRAAGAVRTQRRWRPRTQRRPLGAGLLAAGDLGKHIRHLQAIIGTN